MYTHLLLREFQNYYSLLNNHQQENIGSDQKKISHVWGQRSSPRKTVGGAKSCLKSNPIPAGDAQRDQTKPCLYLETPQRISLTCLWVLECTLWKYGSAVACHRGRGPGCNRPRCGISPLGEVCINPTIEPPELTQDWGNRLLKGTNKTLCLPGPRRKAQWPLKRLTQTCLWAFGGLQQRCGSVVACLRVRGTECGSACMGTFEGGHHYPYYLHHSLVSGQTTGREHIPAHQQKIALKIYWACPRPSEKDPVSSTVSLSHQEGSISFLSFSISGQTEWKPQSKKTNQTDHMDHSLL